MFTFLLTVELTKTLVTSTNIKTKTRQGLECQDCVVNDKNKVFLVKRTSHLLIGTQRGRHD